MPSYSYSGLPGQFRGPGEAASRYLSNYVLPGVQGADQRLQQRQSAYDAALANPTGQADLFSKYFQSAANAYAQPALADFSKQLAATQANTAARFGGNASGTELKNVYNTSDVFSRNLTNALAGLAPQAAQMGLNYTNQLGGAANEAFSQRDALTQRILQGIGMYQQKQRQSNLFGGLAGTILGGALAIPTGGMSVAAGAALGGQIGQQATGGY